MIYIFEDKPRKLSGTSSLFVCFKYDPQIVDIIKQCDGAVFHPDSSNWEVPVTSLSYLLDSLTYLDDIKLIYVDESEQSGEHLKPILTYKTKPFEHQLQAIEYGLNKDKWLLLDGMGLGKSKEIINLAEELKAQKGLEHCLIICGVNTLKTNWKKEVLLHSNQTVRVLGEKINSKGTITYATVDERAAELQQPIEEFFIVTNIETFRSPKVVEAFKKSKNKIDMIAVDEVHRCKSKKSQQGKNLLKLKAKYKIAATGTLLLNNPLDCYVPLVWTENEKANLTNFRNQYCIYGGFGGKEVVGFKNIDVLKQEIESCSLRRTKDLLDLPPKTIINEYVDMSEEHRKFYNAVKKGVKEEVDKIELNSNSVLALVTRLRQATACPSILTTNPIRSTKIDRCVEMVEDIVSNNEKIVIMSTFKDTVNELGDLLKTYNPLICTGDTKQSDIDNMVERFQKDPNAKVMIATWQKMGTGITLTAASYMIFIDTPWTDAVFQQACDRIYRIGTKRAVFIYNLICNDTIDDRVSKLLDTKKAIADFIIDDKLDQSTLNNLRDYIQDL